MSDSHPNLAGLIYGDGDAPDPLLRGFAADLLAQGRRVVGLVQSGHRNGAPRLSATLLHSGEEIELFQDLGPGAQGCRLDAGQLVHAGARIEMALERGADIMILNRFGKLEREGRGLVYLIEKALSAEVPVMMAVADQYIADWTDFSGGIGAKLSCTGAALDNWWKRVYPRPER
jgi:glycosyltransferase involved in cell wall biosynthesis